MEYPNFKNDFEKYENAALLIYEAETSNKVCAIEIVTIIGFYNDMLVLNTGDVVDRDCVRKIIKFIEAGTKIPINYGTRRK